MAANILIFTSEIIWYQLTDRKSTHILSPQEWNITFDDGVCTYKNKQNDETGRFKVDGSLFREGHVVPD